MNKVKDITRQISKIIVEIAIIMIVWKVGMLITTYTHLPIPGSVVGMVLMFALLYFNIIKLSHITKVSNFVLKHLAFFFIPASVGIMASLHYLEGSYLKIFSLIFISSFLVTAITGYTVQKYVNKKDKQ